MDRGKALGKTGARLPVLARLSHKLPSTNCVLHGADCKGASVQVQVGQRCRGLARKGRKSRKALARAEPNKKG